VNGRCSRNAALVAALLLQGACAFFPDHHLIHPDRPGAGIVAWSDVVDVDPLRIHLEWAAPSGAGPHPTVLVHPEGGKSADDMAGIVWDLAARGYVAVAADYERRIGRVYQPNVFAWRSDADVTAALDVVTRSPYVDPGRVGVLGFSQGAVFSLLIAARAPDRVRAVVAYYPVTDFPRWLGAERDGILEPAAVAIVRWFFRRQSGAESEARFQEMLVAASPYYAADRIDAPVLLVHGDRDAIAPVEESERMAARLAELGKTVELLVVPGGVHIFNFRQKDLAATAWEATTRWLDRWVGGLRPADDAEELLHEPVGQAPHDVPVRRPDADAGESADSPAVGDPVLRIHEPRHGHPERLAHLVVRRQQRARVDAIHERRQHERRHEPDAGVHVAETADELGAREVEADLFERLALGGGTGAGVARIDPAARKRHLPRPGIAESLGALDEEQLGATVCFVQDDRDRGATPAGELAELVSAQGGAEVVERPDAHWTCESRSSMRERWKLVASVRYRMSRQRWNASRARWRCTTAPARSPACSSASALARCASPRQNVIWPMPRGTLHSAARSSDAMVASRSPRSW
jgi:dienelactone hydrolase